MKFLGGGETHPHQMTQQLDLSNNFYGGILPAHATSAQFIERIDDSSCNMGDRGINTTLSTQGREIQNLQALRKQSKMSNRKESIEERVLWNRRQSQEFEFLGGSKQKLTKMREHSRLESESV
jgi:hypothetical protein